MANFGQGGIIPKSNQNFVGVIPEGRYCSFYKLQLRPTGIAPTIWPSSDIRPISDSVDIVPTVIQQWFKFGQHDVNHLNSACADGDLRTLIVGGVEDGNSRTIPNVESAGGARGEHAAVGAISVVAWWFVEAVIEAADAVSGGGRKAGGHGSDRGGGDGGGGDWWVGDYWASDSDTHGGNSSGRCALEQVTFVGDLGETGRQGVVSVTLNRALEIEEAVVTLDAAVLRGGRWWAGNQKLRLGLIAIVVRE